MNKEKKFTGYGTCVLENGEYTGELENGVRQGYGVMKFTIMLCHRYLKAWSKRSTKRLLPVIRAVP